jgi:hypothetical protein
VFGGFLGMMDSKVNADVATLQASHLRGDAQGGTSPHIDQTETVLSFMEKS